LSLPLGVTVIYAAVGPSWRATRHVRIVVLITTTFVPAVFLSCEQR